MTNSYRSVSLSRDRISLCSPCWPRTHVVGRLSSNSQSSTYLCLLSANGAYHHAQLGPLFPVTLSLIWVWAKEPA